LLCPLEKDFKLNRIRLDFIIEEAKEIGKTRDGTVLSMKLKLDPKIWDYDEKRKVYIHKKRKPINGNNLMIGSPSNMKI